MIRSNRLVKAAKKMGFKANPKIEQETALGDEELPELGELIKSLIEEIEQLKRMLPQSKRAQLNRMRRDVAHLKSLRA